MSNVCAKFGAAALAATLLVSGCIDSGRPQEANPNSSNGNGNAPMSRSVTAATCIKDIYPGFEDARTDITVLEHLPVVHVMLEADGSNYIYNIFNYSLPQSITSTPYSGSDAAGTVAYSALQAHEQAQFYQIGECLVRAGYDITLPPPTAAATP